MTMQSVNLKIPSQAKVKININEFILEGILIFIFICFAFAAPGFFTTANFFNILRNVSMQGIIAFGMTLVMISGEIDLSVGSMVAFSGCLAAVITRDLTAIGISTNYAVIIGMAVCLLVGICAGVLTGWIRIRFNVPSFITTLALMAGLYGGAFLLTNSFPVTSFPEWYSFFGSGYLLGVIPFPAIVFLVVFGVMWFVSKFTTFGRAVYAVGGNLESSRLSGINIVKVKMISQALLGFLAALSGILVSSQVQAGNPTVAKGWELDVISATVIGGVSMSGGKGRVWRTFIGVIFLGIILNGMTLLNVDEYWQYVVKAVLILGAVLIYQAQEGKQ
ncbi:MAG: ABC transporter permease [Bacteroidota bacterium]